ncbi:hypothetical protein ACN267_08270 [Micromonospora sp. WMMD734]|uniref:hypothetical protein n=1 Tax=Micromonospora sp. WMMD734 TaxID=3404129 RepID=UPI003B950BF5
MRTTALRSSPPPLLWPGSALRGVDREDAVHQVLTVERTGQAGGGPAFAEIEALLANLDRLGDGSANP